MTMDQVWVTVPAVVLPTDAGGSWALPGYFQLWRISASFSPTLGARGGDLGLGSNRWIEIVMALRTVPEVVPAVPSYLTDPVVAPSWYGPGSGSSSGSSYAYGSGSVYGSAYGSDTYLTILPAAVLVIEWNPVVDYHGAFEPSGNTRSG